MQTDTDAQELMKFFKPDASVTVSTAANGFIVTPRVEYATGTREQPQQIICPDLQSLFHELVKLLTYKLEIDRHNQMREALHAFEESKVPKSAESAPRSQ
jgi:hypothetical protein